MYNYHSYTCSFDLSLTTTESSKINIVYYNKSIELDGGTPIYSYMSSYYIILPSVNEERQRSPYPIAFPYSISKSNNNTKFWAYILYSDKFSYGTYNINSFSLEFKWLSY
jgi:hypothetical protein